MHQKFSTSHGCTRNAKDYTEGCMGTNHCTYIYFFTEYCKAFNLHDGHFLSHSTHWHAYCSATARSCNRTTRQCLQSLPLPKFAMLRSFTGKYRNSLTKMSDHRVVLSIYAGYAIDSEWFRRSWIPSATLNRAKRSKTGRMRLHEVSRKNKTKNFFFFPIPTTEIESTNTVTNRGTIITDYHGLAD